MDQRRVLAISIACLLTITTAIAQVPDDPMAEVQRLYASASYEDALAALARVEAQVDANLVDEYRALCLLALNRPKEAEQAVERIVMRRPSLVYGVGDHSPKFVTLHQTVRKRVLPMVASALYLSAKAALERGQLVSASEQFKELRVVLSDSEEAGAMEDLKLLVEGFSKLTEQRLADASPPALPAPAPAPRNIPASSPSDSPERVYGADDADVIPPVIIEQRMPVWIPPVGFIATRIFRGTIEVVVGEDGTVDSRRMAAAAFPSYDRELLSAAQRWKYRPATRNGRPVKYRRLIAVTLGGPRSQ